MNRKHKLSLVSSTPHLKRTAKSVSVLDNVIEAISPIVPVGQVKTAKQPQTALRKPVKPVVENTGKSKKKKCLPTKEKESASRAVLKEMGIKIKAPSTNVLSISSHYLYNHFPQPILLDSDEDTDNLPTITKQSLEKKNTVTQPSTSLAKDKNINCKNPPQKTCDVSNNIKRAKVSIIEKKPVVNNAHETPQTSSSRPRVAKKRPLSDVANTNSEKTKINTKNRQDVVRQNENPSVVCLDSQDSIFSGSALPVNISSVKRKNCLRFSSLEDIGENDVIKWTPRRRELKTCNVIEETGESVKSENGECSESARSKKDDCTVLKTVNVIKTSDNSPLKEKNKKNIDKRNRNVPKKSEATENTLPKELFSRFADIIFKPSLKHKGCVIAPSLTRGSTDFGFLELEGDMSFSGKIPNVTYVLLEGLVKAVHQGKSQNMSPGDIFHIPEGSGYQFQNLQSRHARFLYVKDKNRS